MWASAIVQILSAIFRNFPSIERLVELAVKAAKSSNVAEAFTRKAEKDAAVDAAIDKKENEEIL